VAGNFIPPSQNAINSNGAQVGANLKQALGNVAGKFNMQSLEGGAAQAFSLGSNALSAITKTFGNLSGFVDNPALQTNLQNDLGKANAFMTGSGKGSFKSELGKAFGGNLSPSPKGVSKITKGLPTQLAT